MSSHNGHSKSITGVPGTQSINHQYCSMFKIRAKGKSVLKSVGQSSLMVFLPLILNVTLWSCCVPPTSLRPFLLPQKVKVLSHHLSDKGLFLSSQDVVLSVTGVWLDFQFGLYYTNQVSTIYNYELLLSNGTFYHKMNSIVHHGNKQETAYSILFKSKLLLTTI